MTAVCTNSLSVEESSRAGMRPLIKRLPNAAATVRRRAPCQERVTQPASSSGNPAVFYHRFSIETTL
ncbi:unnamed protein product, partial [Iphiclides podalirius]